MPRSTKKVPKKSVVARKCLTTPSISLLFSGMILAFVLVGLSSGCSDSGSAEDGQVAANTANQDTAAAAPKSAPNKKKKSSSPAKGKSAGTDGKKSGAASGPPGGAGGAGDMAGAGGGPGTGGGAGGVGEFGGEGGTNAGGTPGAGAGAGAGGIGEFGGEGGAGAGGTPGAGAGAGAGGIGEFGGEGGGAGAGGTPGAGGAGAGGGGVGEFGGEGGAGSGALGGAGLGGGAGAGGGGGNSGTAKPPKFKKGSAEDAVLQIVLKLGQGDQTGLKDFISKSATGTLKSLREGKLDKEELAKLKGQLGKVKMAGKPRSGRTTKSISLVNDKKQKIRFKAKKEGTKYRVTSMAITK